MAFRSSGLPGCSARWVASRESLCLSEAPPQPPDKATRGDSAYQALRREKAVGALSPGRRWFCFVWDGLAPGGLCWQLGLTVSLSGEEWCRVSWRMGSLVLGCSGDREPARSVHPPKRVWLRRLTHGVGQHWLSMPQGRALGLAAHQGPSHVKTNIRGRSSGVTVEMEELTRVVRLSQPG